ncbi:MAG: hypothetical protein L0177_03490 [Chloroflexi bacterium]|nr:hypothetical protein [Chloroflexota bacterium]
MEALLIILVPIFLIWFGLALVQGRALTPGAVMRSVTRQLWRTLRWLWRERPQRGGAGRQRPPQRRYRR